MTACEKTTGLSRLLCHAALCLLAALAMFGQTLQAAAQAERFEVASIKAVRPALADTVAALQKGDVAGAKTAFETYDSLWNGIEMYVNTRSKEIYDNLEHGFQARIEKGLSAPSPDVAALLSEARTMLGKYDEAVDFISKSAPLNPLYDDIARLRIVRAHLREVPPALKAGNFDKARKSFSAFDGAWDSIEDMVKAHSADDYVAIEKGMIEIEKALMPEKPDVAAATALVTGVMAKYNVTLAALVKEARSRP
jgi:hypothetical protein